MASILIAESGSTKTDWYYTDKDGTNAVHVKTTGINPFLQTGEDIKAVVNNELQLVAQPEQVFFYGAGAGSDEKQVELQKILAACFPSSKVDVHGDMMAAARGLCGSEQGVVAILGTGSNSCYYDGVTMKSHATSLGYIVGDEGSGNHMGKQVLRYYTYKMFDDELLGAFEHLFGNDIGDILDNIYKKPFPNRYLARFAKLLVQNRGHYMVENIIEDSINEFFYQHILKYRETWVHPVNFTGSIAYEFKDIIANFCNNNEINLGKIIQSPLQGLIDFHTK